LQGQALFSLVILTILLVLVVLLILLVLIVLSVLLVLIVLFLLAAVFTALVDALPILGCGTILFPWAAASFLLGNTGQAIALILLYAVVLLVHSLLEPKLLARQADLSPLAALAGKQVRFDGCVAKEQMPEQVMGMLW